jgi:hypothetical protein
LIEEANASITAVLGCDVRSVLHAPTVIQRRGIAVYDRIMAKDVIHISEAAVASKFASLMARARAGAEVIIENDARPVAVLHPAGPVRRTISECIPPRLDGYHRS